MLCIGMSMPSFCCLDIRLHAILENVLLCMLMLVIANIEAACHEICFWQNYLYQSLWFVMES